jgi:hypothetical protein
MGADFGHIRGRNLDMGIVRLISTAFHGGPDNQTKGSLDRYGMEIGKG